MKDLQGLMKQAQGMQQKLAAAQAKLADAEHEGRSGGGLVTLRLKGSGELTALSIRPELFAEADAETLADLVMSAHGEARARLEAASKAAMDQAMGPLAGMAGLASRLD